MKKWIGAGVGLLLLVLLVLPAWFGRMAEEAVVDYVEQPLLGDRVRARVVDYRRGWFRSRATVEIGLDEDGMGAVLAGSGRGDHRAGSGGRAVLAGSGGHAAVAGRGQDAEDGEPEGRSVPGGAPAGATLRLGMDVVHGPVGYARGPFVGLASGVARIESSEEAEELRQRLGVPYLVEVRHRIGLGGSSRLEVEVPPVDLREEDVRVSSSGLEARVRFDPDGRRLAGEATLEELEVADDESNVRLVSMTADLDGSMAARTIFLGTFGVQVERFTLLRPLDRVPRTELVGVGFSGDTRLSEDETRIHTTISYMLDSVTAGPFEVSDARMRIAARDVDLAAADAYNQLSQRAVLPRGDQPLGELGEEEVARLIHDLIAAGPSLEVDPLEFQYRAEPFRAEVRVETDPSVLPPRDDFDPFGLEDLGVWRRLFRASAEAEASRELVRSWLIESQRSSLRAGIDGQGGGVPDAQIDAMAGRQADALLSGLVEQGFVTDADSVLSSRLTFEDGRLTVNGRSMPIPGL